VGEAEELEREDVERRGGWEELVGARWRVGAVDVEEVVALDNVRLSRFCCACCCWGVV
jgi:hypothetical protein